MAYVIQTTHRAVIGADTAITLWVRDEAGKADFGGTEEVPAVLSVEIRGYSYALPLETVAAESVEAGKVTFTLTATFTDQKLAPGLFRLYVKDGTEVVATGLLEVVG